MEEWNSFKRIEAVFNHKIPDKVPKYEGTIEIPELNSNINGQTFPQTILFFPPNIINIFHKVPIVPLIKRIM